MPDLKTQTINGVKCQIHVNDDGEFVCSVAGEWHNTDTLKELLNTLKRVTKKMKVDVAVPAMLIGTEVGRSSNHFRVTHGKITCVPVTLIGMDWRSGQVKYRDRDGAVKTFGRGTGFYNREAYIGKVMTTEEVAEWERLLKEKVAADSAFLTFDQRFHFSSDNDAEAQIKAAQAAKLDTPDEPDEPDTDEEDGDPR